MAKIRLAVVEDDKIILNDRCENLEELKDECNIEVVIKASNAEEFFYEYRKNPDNVDALILDIDLSSTYSGIQIAAKLMKPCMFVSDYNAENLRSIEDLSDTIKVVMHISKPITDDKFKNKIRDFCNEIRLHHFHNQMLNFTRNGSSVRIPARDIVFVESISDGSNNKVIYFKGNRPLQLNDVSFSKIRDWCQNTAIVQISKSCYVNKEHIESKEQGVVKVSYMNREGEPDNRPLPVSPNYVKNIR